MEPNWTDVASAIANISTAIFTAIGFPFIVMQIRRAQSQGVRSLIYDYLLFRLCFCLLLLRRFKGWLKYQRGARLTRVEGIL